MSHKNLRPFIVKVSVLGYFPLHCKVNVLIQYGVYCNYVCIRLYIYIRFYIYFNIYNFKIYIKSFLYF